MLQSGSIKSKTPPEKKMTNSDDDDDDNNTDNPDVNVIQTEKSLEADEYPYTVFNQKQRLIIAFTCGISGFWSAVSGNIYYPIIVTIQNKFHVTEELANVSVVLYFILQGITPMFTASIADSIGRKPVVLFCCVVYVVSCACIGASDAYWLILLLRCIQAGGISPVIAINSGVCADLADRAHRASLIGFTSGIQLLAQAIGALIGGVLAYQYNSWRAIFWFLSIGCGVTAILSFFILPETKRSIVGNGSVPPKKFINKSPIWLLPQYKKLLTNDTATLEPKNSQSILTKLFDVPKICSRKDVLMVLIPISFYFCTWTMMFTSLSTNLQNQRGYTVLHVGLCFIAPGVAGCIGSLLSGKVLDWYFQARHKKFVVKLQEWENSDKLKEKPIFDIFKCRIGLLFPCAGLFNGGLLIFAWCLGENQPLAPILIGAFMNSLVNSPFVSASMNLLADMYPTKTSTSTACVNLTRCLMAACGVAALSKMEKAMTIGGCFTLMAGFCSVSMIPLYIVYQNGYRWNKEYLAKAKEAEKARLKKFQSAV